MLMEGKSVEEIMEFMDQNEKTLSENPFDRRSAKNIIVEEKKEVKEENKEIKEESEEPSKTEEEKQDKE